MTHELLDRALKEIDFVERRKKFKIENANPKNVVKRGIGVASFMHGLGFTGAGEKYLASVAGVEGTQGGKIRVLAASTEIGQGTNTVFSQIVADTLGLPIEMVEVAQPDTKFVPDSGPTVASRTCMVVGKLVENASVALKQTLVQSRYLKAEYSDKQFAEAIVQYLKDIGPLKSFAEYRQPSHIVWDEHKYSGDAYTTFAWATYASSGRREHADLRNNGRRFCCRSRSWKSCEPDHGGRSNRRRRCPGRGFCALRKRRLEKRTHG